VALTPVRFTESRVILLAGLRREHAFDEAAQGIPAQWEEFRRLGPIAGQRGRTAYGVMCGVAPERRVFEYMCGVEVAGFDAVPAGLGRLRIPARRYAVFAHDGHVSALHAAWDAIWNEWLPRSGYRSASAPDFEVYGERFDPAAGHGGIELWSPIDPVDAPSEA
jgi:AraC family transcriptional regulator